MGKAKATEKDARYALEYGGERLIRTIRSDGSGKFDYTLSPSNMIITEATYQALEMTGFLQEHDSGLFDGHPQSFVARHA